MTCGEAAHPALYWHREGEAVRCDLCPHRCLLPRGARGVCGVRKHASSGEMVTLNWGLTTAPALDPVEKKPLYHWRPGTQILSLGTVGCNMTCPFCQNWHLSRGDERLELISITPEELVGLAKKYKSNAVAFTYNEPFVWYEFVKTSSELLKQEKIAVVLVTNGLVLPEPLNALLPYVGAANVDLKTFTKEGYRKLGGDFECVKGTIAALLEGGVHVEITHLVVTGFNDCEEHFGELVDWIASLSPDIPLHISRYFPQYRWYEPPTSIELLHKFQLIASEKLHYVYLGNVTEPAVTCCSGCGEELIVRHGYRVVKTALDTSSACLKCGNRTGIVLK